MACRAEGRRTQRRDLPLTARRKSVPTVFNHVFNPKRDERAEHFFAWRRRAHRYLQGMKLYHFTTANRVASDWMGWEPKRFFTRRGDSRHGLRIAPISTRRGGFRFLQSVLIGAWCAGRPS